MPPGQRGRLHPAPAAFRAPIRHRLFICPRPIEAKHSTGTEPSQSCRNTMPAPGFRTVPRWTHYVGTCDRSLRCRPSRRRDLGQFSCRINPYEGQGQRHTPNLHLQNLSFYTRRDHTHAPNQPASSLKIMLVRTSRSKPFSRERSHVCPLHPHNQPEPERQVSHRPRCKKSSAPSPFVQELFFHPFWKTYPVQSGT